MADDQQNSGPVQKTTQSGGRSLDLRSGQLVDLSGLDDQQVAALQEQHASGMIDIQKKAQEMHVDAEGLRYTLDNLNQQTEKATQARHSMTSTHTHTNSLGRTEVVVGNTERAAAGKLSRSAAGLQDNTTILGIIGAVAAVIIAILAFA